MTLILSFLHTFGSPVTIPTKQMFTKQENETDRRTVGQTNSRKIKNHKIIIKNLLLLNK